MLYKSFAALANILMCSPLMLKLGQFVRLLLFVVLLQRLVLSCLLAQ